MVNNKKENKMDYEKLYYKVTKKERISPRGMHNDEFREACAELRGFKLGAKEVNKRSEKLKESLIYTRNNLKAKITIEFDNGEIFKYDLNKVELNIHNEVEVEDFDIVCDFSLKGETLYNRRE